ncbi:MAG: hypothetical protein ABIP65_11110 [Vicinamibacterales bacterium]
MKPAIALLSLTLVAGCNGVSAKTMSYGTLAEARTAGAIDQGWVPAGVPDSAFELRVAYVPDGWQRWGLFNFPAASVEGLRAVVEPEELPLAGVRCDIPGRIEWWPVLLREALDAQRVAATGARAYRSRDGKMIFVVNWTQGRAYYWTTG